MTLKTKNWVQNFAFTLDFLSKVYTHTPINICLNGPQLVAAQPDSFVSHRQVSDIILAGYLTTLLSATFKPLISQLKVCMPHHTEFIDIQFNSIIFI